MNEVAGLIQYNTNPRREKYINVLLMRSVLLHGAADNGLMLFEAKSRSIVEIHHITYPKCSLYFGVCLQHVSRVFANTLFL